MTGKADLLQAEPPLPAILTAALELVADNWPAAYQPLRELRQLRDRFHHSQFQLAIVGQFKRGKSTFINALLGEDILPSAVVPLTAINTFIAWGPAPRVRITYAGTRAPDDFHPADIARIEETLHPFVTEEANPSNRRGVARVDVALPADLLRDGVVVIDTPGIGSTLRHNTATAFEALPACDAAFFIVSADPPITQAEIAYLADVRRHATHVFFVLNKIDYLEPSERTQVESFLRDAVTQASAESSSEVTIFPLSARQALAAKRANDTVALEASGLPRVERETVSYLAHQKETALRLSVMRKATALLDYALSDLELRIRSLELPLFDLERRKAQFEEAMQGFEAERRHADDLLRGDRTRATAELEQQSHKLRHDGHAYVMRAIKNAMAGRFNLQAARHATSDAIPEFFEARLEDVATGFRHLVETILAAHQARSARLIDHVRRTASDLFEVPFRAALETEPFRLGSEPYWVTQQQRELLLPLTASPLLRFLPARLRRRRLCRQLDREVTSLVYRNVENLRWATLQGLHETFRRFASRLDEHLADGLAVTQGVIASTLERRQTHADEAEAELARLRDARPHLAALRLRLAEHAASETS